LEEQQKVDNALDLNGYPRKMINRFSQLRPTSDVPSQSTTTNSTYVSIPYVKGTSEAIRRILAPLDIKTTFRPNNTLRQILLHPKILLHYRTKLVLCIKSLVVAVPKFT
jgi:hypothetical protein